MLTTSHTRYYYTSVVSGFTLVELMVVVAIIGILFAISGSGAGLYYRNKEAAYIAEQLHLDINLARNIAVTEKSATEIRPINNAWDNGWQIFVDGNLNPRQQRGGNDAETRIVDNLGTITSPIFIDENTPIAFDITGRATRTGTLQILTPDCSGNAGRNIRIAFSGQVIITDVACP